MIPDTAGNIECLPSFNMMYNNICASAIHTISIAGLPASLDTLPVKRDANDTQREDRLKRQRTHATDPDPSSSDQLSTDKKAQKEDPWHPKLKAALQAPMKIAKKPSLKKICEYCGILKNNPVLPNAKKTDCRHYLMFGECRWGPTCRFRHGTATDAQATTVLNKFEKFIKAPDGLPGK